MTRGDEHLLAGVVFVLEGHFMFTDWNTQYYEEAVDVLQIHI